MLNVNFQRRLSILTDVEKERICAQSQLLGGCLTVPNVLLSGSEFGASGGDQKSTGKNFWEGVVKPKKNWTVKIFLQKLDK